MINKNQRKRIRPYSLGNFKVLFVDDFLFIADMSAMMLSAMGIGRAVTASSGQQAQERLLQLNAERGADNIDVVISDWMMPGSSGHDLLRWIRSRPEDTIRFLPVIICTASASREMVELSRDGGATEVLVKPVSAQKIAERLIYLIDSPRPFLETPAFFGPDRRRRLVPHKGSDRRSVNSKNIKVNHESAA